MILGKKDKEHVATLNKTIAGLHSTVDYLMDKEEHNAVAFLNYLHDELGYSYVKIAAVLGVSQQYINSICIGKAKIKNKSLYKMISKLFIEAAKKEN